MAKSKKSTPQNDPFVWLSDKLRGTGEKPGQKISKPLRPKASRSAEAERASEVRRRSINVSSAKRHQTKKRPK